LISQGRFTVFPEENWPIYFAFCVFSTFYIETQ